MRTTAVPAAAPTFCQSNSRIYHKRSCRWHATLTSKEAAARINHTSPPQLECRRPSTPAATGTASVQPAFDEAGSTGYYSVTPMGRTTETMTVSLPPAMMEEVDRVCSEEHRTKSELVREALRAYFTQRASGGSILASLPKRRSKSKR